jgi:hypothetical protein
MLAVVCDCSDYHTDGGVFILGYFTTVYQLFSYIAWNNFNTFWKVLYDNVNNFIERGI